MSRTLIVSNRLPVTLRVEEDEAILEPSLGGLATGLASLMEAPTTLWVGWPGDLSELTESAAIARIESSGLCYGGTYKETNDAKQGTVFKQSAPANTQLTEYSKVYIWVSDGPKKP